MNADFDLSTFLPYRLSVLAEQMSRRLAEAYERSHGLTTAQWRVLVHVQRAGQASVREIHRAAHLDKPKVSRAVARLEARGLVQKTASQGDGRLVEITLTAEGQGVLDQLIPVVTGIEAELLAALTEPERAAFSAGMDKLQEALSR